MRDKKRGSYARRKDYACQPRRQGQREPVDKLVAACRVPKDRLQLTHHMYACSFAVAAALKLACACAGLIWIWPAMPACGEWWHKNSTRRMLNGTWRPRVVAFVAGRLAPSLPACVTCPATPTGPHAAACKRGRPCLDGDLICTCNHGRLHVNLAAAYAQRLCAFGVLGGASWRPPHPTCVHHANTPPMLELLPSAKAVQLHYCYLQPLLRNRCAGISSQGAHPRNSCPKVEGRRRSGAPPLAARVPRR